MIQIPDLKFILLISTLTTAVAMLLGRVSAIRTRLAETLYLHCVLLAPVTSVAARYLSHWSERY